MVRWERLFNAVLVYILCGVLVGAFAVQYLEHEEPCPLCLLQRLAMIAIASSALLNVFFGIRIAHYGLALLGVLVGGFVALRQISMHVCPGFPEFGVPVLGLSLYTWSFLVFVCSVLYISLLLFLYDPLKSGEEPSYVSTFGKFAFALLFVIAVANALSVYSICGFGPCG